MGNEGCLERTGYSSISAKEAHDIATELGLDKPQSPVYKEETGSNACLNRFRNAQEYLRFDAEAKTLGWSRLDEFNTSESVKTREDGFAMLNTIDTNAYDYMIVQEPNLKHYLIYTKPKTLFSDLEDAQ